KKATHTAAARMAGTIRIDMESSRICPFLRRALAAEAAGTVTRRLLPSRQVTIYAMRQVLSAWALMRCRPAEAGRFRSVVCNVDGNDSAIAATFCFSETGTLWICRPLSSVPVVVVV